MRRPGIEPGSSPWKGEVIAIRPPAPNIFIIGNVLKLAVAELEPEQSFPKWLFFKEVTFRP